MPRKAAVSKAKSVATSLQTALLFCKCASKDIGPDYATHVTLHEGWMTAFDGVLAAGHPIDETFTAAPNAARLRDALARPGSGLTLALAADGAHMAVRVGGFSCRVPCLPVGATLTPAVPDPIMSTGPVAALIDGLRAVSSASNKNAEYVSESSVHLQSGTVSATNRTNIVLQYYHSLSMPDVLLPAEFAKIAAGIKTLPIGVGATENTFTIHYEDKTWLRTQLYNQAPLNVNTVFENVRPETPTLFALGPDFFEACAAVLPFAGEGGRIICEDGAVTVEHGAARHECKISVGEPVGLPGAMLSHVAQATSVDWHSGVQTVYFYNNLFRSAVSRLAR